MPTSEMAMLLALEALYQEYVRVAFRADVPGRRKTFLALIKEDPHFMALGPLAQFAAVEGLI